MTAALPRRIGLALLVAIGACSEPTGSGRRPVDASLLVRADLSATGVMTVVVEVTAADIPTPLVFNIPVVDRVASGPVTIPSGSNRTITMRAFDAGGVETHHGSVTVNIQPGTNPTISIVLMPLTGSVPIDATLGSFAVSVRPTVDTLTVGDTVTLTAAILDATGTPVTGQVAWGSVGTAVATVVSTGPQTGRVTAMHPGRTTVAATYGGTAALATIVVPGWYASPSGSSAGDGSRQPWDLQTALRGGQGRVQPGDTIWLRGGTYQGSFTSTLNGSEAAPIVVRQYPGERATVDGANAPSANLVVDGAWTVFWGFELTNSSTGRFCPDCLALRPAGVYVRNAANVKLINLVVHDVGHGVFTENAAQNIEIYGWIIYNGGNTNSLRSDGHGIYIKNDGVGTKIARDNVIFNMFGYGIHGYSEVTTGELKRMTFDGNVAFNNGSLSLFVNERDLVLGSSVAVADNDVVSGNMVYHSPGVRVFRTVQIGDSTLVNGTLTFRDNYIAAGDNAGLAVGYWGNLQVQNNTFVGTSAMVDIGDTTRQGWQWGGNQYWRDPQAAAWTYNGTDYTLDGWRAATGLGATDQAMAGQPPEPRVFVRPNQYEPGRANVIIYNWTRQGSVSVDLSGVLQIGDRFEVRNVQDLWGTPVVAGTYGGGAVNVPTNGVTPPQPIGGSPVAPIRTGPDFDVFIVARVGSN